MPPRIILSTLTLIVIVVTSCSIPPRRESQTEPRFLLTVEEAGFVVKGELFRIYGEDADPVIVDVDASPIHQERLPGWRFDTLVDVLIDGRLQERRWRFWVTLDPAGFPTVVRAEDISRSTEG